MKSKDLSKNLKKIIEVLDKHPAAGVILRPNIGGYSDGLLRIKALDINNHNVIVIDESGD